MCGTKIFMKTFVEIVIPTMLYQCLLMSDGYSFVNANIPSHTSSLKTGPNKDPIKYPRFPPKNIGIKPMLMNFAMNANF